ncbi:DE-cadherin [Orchesella cincta]|uniref:DE-cadherin n=1 Tax=Orchesella cincta TaxID=48709 RepID=A0A1D2N5H2_ORCCI|nr:DE-cadherin [Orchesella cincta]
MREIHKHRQHHGHDHPRSRTRRFGRETDAPLVQNYQSYLSESRVTEPYAPYSYRQDLDESPSRFSSDQNLHKPEFLNCSKDITPSVPEGEPVNTTVFRVEARDIDPPEFGGTVTYSIVSGNENNDKFAIDPRTGVIRTNKVFDRDEPEREKEEYLTIRATDNGRPQLDTVCTIKIIITDINDGVPLFERFEYKESVPRDLSTGQVVMRISATDIDDRENGTVWYKLDSHPESPGDLDYFKISETTGEVQLKKPIDANTHQFLLRAIASDKGSPPKSATTNLTINVIEPRTRPPSFDPHRDIIYLRERGVDKTRPIETLTAKANADSNLVFFELVNGQTEPTNKGAMFTIEADGNTAQLKLDKDLDYEAVSKYTLTIRVKNKDDLATETTITIFVEDDNDEKVKDLKHLRKFDPDFTEVTSGVVLEDENVGTSVMRVRAIDRDGTSPNRDSHITLVSLPRTDFTQVLTLQVTYALKEEDRENFEIDPITGEITTTKKFDREVKDVYQVTVIARDGYPSALRSDGLPNERPITLKIEIADKNDNSPVFLKSIYEAEISEDADANNRVIEVKAIDKDTGNASQNDQFTIDFSFAYYPASEIKYSITQGNIGDAFSIINAKSGGVIYVSKKLDYEEIKDYDLTVQASDSIHETYTHVKIRVININDEPPKFEGMKDNTTILEESIPSNCVFQLKAYDPDIGDRSVPQNISYFILQGKENFNVDDNGCVKVTKPLDRDHGDHIRTVIVGAYDEGGLTATKLAAYQSLKVYLEDINDNAPFLNSTNPVVWDENQPKGPITKLYADDFDDPTKNGPPFHFSIDRAAPPEIRTLFRIDGNSLSAEKDNFDREEKKEYLVPITISDSGKEPQTGTSTLTVIIGDENDSKMFPGESKIFVYKYKEKSPFPIGRVYVEDEDDWDLPDKTFDWQNGIPHTFFNLDHADGYINMKPTATAGTYQLSFKVTDNKHNQEVNANVNVTVKEITDEAIESSGSIRFAGITKEGFIKPDSTGKSKKDLLQDELAARFGVPKENVDIFTVLNPLQSPDPYQIDVRYSVHNSPYWKAEKLDGILAGAKETVSWFCLLLSYACFASWNPDSAFANLQKSLQLQILMIRIDECAIEKSPCEFSCTNHLNKSEISYKIFTNTTSFVGVDAYVTASCTCSSAVQQNGCLPNNPCLHGGTCKSGGGKDGFECECEAGYDGPRCEKTSIALQGNSYAWYQPLSVCNDSSLELQFTTGYKDGLIFYNGPIFPSPMNVTGNNHFVSLCIALENGVHELYIKFYTRVDFVSLELRDGKPLLLMDYGTGVAKVELVNSPNLGNSLPHQVSIKWNPKGISMRIDDCLKNEPACFSDNIPPIGNNSQLNVNGPLQIGGISFNPASLQSYNHWSSIPSSKKFTGCIANVTFNGMFYNLGAPSYAYNMNVTDCDNPLIAGSFKTLSVDWNFIIVILVSILVLLLLIMAFLFYRKRRSYEEVKGEFNDDVRDNILHYSDEGGGEGDQTGYDLSVLMKASNGPPYINPHMDKIAMDDLNRQGRAPESGEGPDIQSFLTGNKNKVDNDPDGLPYDDVRNYAYEGDGNSMGSLSSLASGTDDEDLNFDFLPAFGPRFKKLADMYGGQSSDDESYTPPPEAWC